MLFLNRTLGTIKPTFPSDDIMNFLILGAGALELVWARAIARDPSHHLLAAYPGFAEFPDLTRPADFDDALALADLEAVVVGGEVGARGESLRRVAAAGLTVLCLHPPGDDSEAYYQVALSREETGAVVVPDLPSRLHPAIASLKAAVDAPANDPELGPFRGLTVHCPVESGHGAGELDLARHVLPRLVDPVRVLLGEIEAVTATGDPPGARPTESLIVQLRGRENRRAEVRIERAPEGPAPAAGRLVINNAAGALTLEHSPTWDGPARLIRRTTAGGEAVTELEPWDPHAAMLAVLIEAASGRDRDVRPNLLDGTRAMELAEATVRSLVRGRTVDLHYEEISEAATFKSVMTSVGCLVFLAVLVVLPAALVGPPLGFPGTVYLAYAIPPILVLYILGQLFRFALRDRRERRGAREDPGE
jgi:myo-inositol 2-dehydrogenase/D-chiro-inositol 1-dehydrogenase